jgi:toxin ParE1/3/4
MNLVLAPRAAEDLQAISAYTLETWGPEQEERYLQGLWTRLAEIREHPESFRMRTEFAAGCRSARVGSHVIFFRIREQALEVMRILHVAMDYSRHLEGG